MLIAIIDKLLLFYLYFNNIQLLFFDIFLISFLCRYISLITLICRFLKWESNARNNLAIAAIKWTVGNVWKKAGWPAAHWNSHLRLAFCTRHA